MELHRSVWGPRYWAFIHTAAMTATDVPTTKATLRSVVENVPCSECAPHARQYMQQHASEYAAITTAPQLAAFYVAFHNAVSARVGNERAHTGGEERLDEAGVAHSACRAQQRA